MLLKKEKKEAFIEKSETRTTTPPMQIGGRKHEKTHAVCNRGKIIASCQKGERRKNRMPYV